MDKTARLFAIMDTLRRHRQPVTAGALAEEHGVSLRTLYRDMQTLMALGAPIEGEAGIGYMLRKGYFLPPLMFSADELEALVLGARWVEDQPDDDLSGAAANALGKIRAAAPDDLRERIDDTGLWPVRMSNEHSPLPVLGQMRQAMRAEQAVRIDYADEAGAVTSRTIWPVQIAYYENKQIIVAWCTLREDFRHFRTERVRSADITGERFGERRPVLAGRWRQAWLSERGRGS
ncbi:helix-turn-helix transcriptional regulator [Pelagibacterium xiamenense]|uniref:helix-turn-helix transcriptional regulator n=1 Tax=Pelagibacterium xiamenense TaxID=2901140 RepID=UPI001E30A981|nr:YafY family protein [Pelagibacterium xiamenense]MCD7059755.1 YafY family transcriptional regulator [Pelagibacterium xiamenense]